MYTVVNGVHEVLNNILGGIRIMLRERFVVRNHHNPHTSGCCGTGGEGCCGGDNHEHSHQHSHSHGHEHEHVNGVGHDHNHDDGFSGTHEHSHEHTHTHGHEHSDGHTPEHK